MDRLDLGGEDLEPCLLGRLQVPVLGVCRVDQGLQVSLGAALGYEVIN